MSKQDKTLGVRRVVVGPDRAGQRLDNFLATQLKGVPRSAVYRLIRTGQVRVNGGRCKAFRRLQESDEVRIPPALTRERGAFTVPERACREIEQAIIYEDADLLVIDKPAGMAVHAGSGLAWGLIDVVRQSRPGAYIELVHRLDRETSGCLVLALSGAALNELSRQFREGRVSKHYLCLLDGVLGEPVVEVDAPLAKARGPEQHEVRVHAQGKTAKTRFRLLQGFTDCSYVEAELFTGRTHQIRAHARHLGLPLAGDERYGSREGFKRWKQRGLRRVFLHAHRVRLRVPSGLDLVVDAPLPPDLRRILDGLGA
jgi:23S rRNA pseudouridine955/2504/2580 synthase